MNKRNRYEYEHQRLCRIYKEKRVYNQQLSARGRAHIRRLRSRPCHDCKEKFPWYVMEFDHVRGKRYRCVAAMQNCSIENINREVALCDVVCANCHRKRTHRRGQQKRRKPANRRQPRRLGERPASLNR